MTVSELIAELQTFPGRALVYVENRTAKDVQPLVAVSSANNVPEDEIYLQFGEEWTS